MLMIKYTAVMHKVVKESQNYYILSKLQLLFFYYLPYKN